MSTTIRTDDWTVCQLAATRKWVATVRYGDGEVNCEFDSRYDAVDWCLDLVVMRNLLGDEPAAPPSPIDRFPPAYPCELPESEQPA